LTKHNSGYKGDDSRAQGYDNTRDRKIATLCCGYKADIGIRRLAAQMGADARRILIDYQPRRAAMTGWRLLGIREEG